MKKIHPYRHMRPKRIEFSAKENLSYSVSRYAQDQDIRFGFGECGKKDDSDLKVIEIDYAWLGVVFHLLISTDDNDSAYNALNDAKDNLEKVKKIAKEVILESLSRDPNRLLLILETIHEASREQGHLEVIKNTISAMNVTLDLSEHQH